MGCNPAPPAPVIERASPSVILPDLSDTCGHASLDGFIGLPYSDLADAPDLWNLRIIRPGEKVEANISPSRLNVQVDSTDTVRRIFCG